MATFYNHGIDEGDSSFSTLDPREFCSNRTGRGPRYEHSTLMGEESEEHGIYGFCGDLYCPHCQETFDFILVEFEQPFLDFLSAWRETIMKEMDEDITQCPRCGRRNMELV
jgi:hypothetical protein